MNYKLLIVEDEGIIALDLKTNLEKLGYDVVGTADNGEEAIEIAKETHPDIVLMDIQLKGDMNGIDAAESISEFEIPVVFLTANNDSDTFEKSNIKGSYGFVGKPYNIKKLDKTLKITLNRIKKEGMDTEFRIVF